MSTAQIIEALVKNPQTKGLSVPDLAAQAMYLAMIQASDEALKTGFNTHPVRVVEQGA